MAQRRISIAQVAFLAIVLLLCIVIIPALLRQAPQQGSAPATSPPASPDLLLGNPSNATADASNKDNYLSIKPFYSLSFNSDKGIPNWVSWRVTAADLGSAPRKSSFDPDTTLPPGFNVVTHKDYSSSGFDRGHLCPHGDRTANQEMSYATFVMTNIIPQAPNVNRKAWEQLESYSRDLVQQHNHLYIIAGGNGQGGRGSRGSAQTIANGKVVVPAECWKIIVVVPESASDNDLSQITSRTRVITVLMPNDNDAVGEAWAGFRTNPANIESKTGYHFFDRLPPETDQALRQKIDTDAISPPRTRSHEPN